METDIDNMTIFQHSLSTTLVVSTKKGCFLVREDSQGFQITNHFNPGPNTLPWLLLSESLLVMATEPSGAQVYEFSTKKIRELKTASQVRFILPTGDAGTVVLVDDKGRVTVAETGDRPA
ncbi:hypothetical protein [Chitinophaga pinensis]|uniref:Uncharacterized protein n=1 Tax=Chitinophaga pinensis TaxID=79329 RepID=A0A5C6LPK4_9BACT|nr:hypothetical protein [Chitinophaga pinensis]TWV98030.1 hypothetical protein FEF09_20900 [Chitinophaga pinensis]